MTTTPEFEYDSYCEATADPWHGDRYQEHLDTEGTKEDYLREAFGDSGEGDHDPEDYEPEFLPGALGTFSGARALVAGLRFLVDSFDDIPF